MAKVGRNKPCSCGSGKKYKACCGSRPARSANNAVLAEQSLDDSQDITVTVGLPGQRLYIDRYIQSQDPNDSTPAKVYGGEPSEYKVVFTLNRPGFPLHSEYAMTTADKLKGDSHLAITKPALDDPLTPDANRVMLGFEIPSIGNVEFIGYPNDEGYLGKIELESISTNSFKDAEEAAYYLLAPMLSYFSTYLDVPLNVYQVDITELKTGSMRVSLVNPFPGAPLVLAPEIGINNEWRGYASLYREALNSNSSAYQFLCLFRIIEGIQERHKRLGEEARERGEVFSRPRIIIPDTKEDQVRWLNDIFPVPNEWDGLALSSIFINDALGKRAGGIIENYLRPLRNDIAHALSLDSVELTVSIDEAFHNDRLRNWLPLTKCITRWMLKNEFPKELSFIAARQVEIE
jgi:SEC-C motif